MTRSFPATGVLLLLLAPVFAYGHARAEKRPRDQSAPRVVVPPKKRTLAAPAGVSKSRAGGVSLDEARRSVEMLNEVYQLTLQEIHRRFPVGSGQPVVAALVIRDIQKRMNTRYGLQSRFLAVDLRAMNPDHAPKDAFEREAAEKLAAGARRWETIENGRLRMATVVPLGGTCFPCHSTPTGGVGRAAISWTIPLAK